MACETISQAHHLTHAQPKARGMKAGDQFTVPLCVAHHDPNSGMSVHAAGNEARWWAALSLEPVHWSNFLWRRSISVGRVTARVLAA